MQNSIYKTFYQHLTENKQEIPDFLFEIQDLSHEQLQKMKEIEASAFPPHMQMMNSELGDNDLTMDMVLDYITNNVPGLSPNDVDIYVGNSWYMITHYEDGGRELHIDDVAAMGGQFGRGVAFAFISVLSGLMQKAETCHVDAREGTSYVMLKDAEKNGRLTIQHDRKWDWGGVKMHKVEFTMDPEIVQRLNRRKNKQ